MTDIDTDAMLRGAFARAAEPGDPAGVAEAIRTRLAAGDTGTPAAPPRPPVWAWILGGVLAVLLVLAAVLLWPRPSVEPIAAPVTPSSTAMPTPTSTPTPTATISPTPTPTVIEPVETPTAAPTQAPPPAPPPPAPAPPGDTIAPSITQYGISQVSVCVYDNSPPYADHADATALATDTVGVTGVAISWSGADSGAGSMTNNGSYWTFAYNPPSSAPSGTVTFTMRAMDAAGNTSAPVTVTLQLDDQCLI